MTLINGTKVTFRDPPPSTGGSEGVPPERETPTEAPGTLHPPVTVGDRLRGLFVGLRHTADTRISPPTVLAEREPAVAQIRSYAHRARYTGPSGPVRAVGVGWCYLVAIPNTVGARWWAWGWERPARAVVIAATVKCLSELPPVEWAVDTVIKPGADVALWLFL